MNAHPQSPQGGNAVAPHTRITEIVAQRDAALAAATQAVATLDAGHKLAQEAQQAAGRAHGGAVFRLKDRSKEAAYTRLFDAFDPHASLRAFRQQLDAQVWMHLIDISGIDSLMDKTARDALYQDLCGDVPEVTEDAVRAILSDLAGDAGLIFQRGLARAFSELDRRFKSHDGFKVGSRIILTRVFNSWGSVCYHSRMAETLADIERVFAVLDGKKPEPGALMEQIREDRKNGGLNARQSVSETPYFRIRCFKNGNAHLWMKRDDLVDKVNHLLADYYGEVLPDGVAADGSREDEADLRSKSGLPSKDLAFYPTSEETVAKALRVADVYIDESSRVLEPSAGTGGIVKALWAKGATVDAVEVDPGRCQQLALIRPRGRGVLTQANFLRLAPNPIYTHVVMNPPFCGTHWMEHVVHAFDFLAPGGTLVAILPVSAELGESRKHKTFRAWAKKHARYGNLRFSDLPAESFAHAGTRINTVVLRLHKAR